jgi:hypothetical protein
VHNKIRGQLYLGLRKEIFWYVTLCPWVISFPTFTFMWPCIVTNFLIVKPTRCTNFSNLFWNAAQHVADSSSVHHQELFTVNSAMVYVIQQDKDVPSCCCSKAIYKPVWHIPLLNVQWCTPDDGQRNFRKCRVSFQNEFEKLVHALGFTITKLVSRRFDERSVVFKRQAVQEEFLRLHTIWISRK